MLSLTFPKDEAVRKVVTDYMNIVGGKQMSAEIVNSNRRLNLILMSVYECLRKPYSSWQMEGSV